MRVVAPTPSPRRSPISATARAAIAGWAAWCLFLAFAGVVTANALRDRYTGTCLGPGEGGRDWVFELLPFAQTCVVLGVPPPLAASAVIQTVVIALALVVGLAATAYLLTRGPLRELPRLAASLIIAQAAGIALAGVTFVVRHDAREPSVAGGADVGFVGDTIIALIAASVLTVVLFTVTGLVGLGRTRR